MFVNCEDVYNVAFTIYLQVHRLKKRRLKIFLIATALVTAIVRYLLRNQTDTVEQYYSRGVYTWIREVFDHTLYYVPIPMIFIFLSISVVYLLHILIRPFRSKDKPKERLLKFGLSLAAFSSLLYFSFMWLWGFNYLRVPIEDTLHFDSVPIPAVELKNKLIARLPDLVAAREAIQRSTEKAIDTSFIPDNFEDKIRNKVMQTLQHYGYPASSKVQGRFLPNGTLLRISTSGIYFPFVGESNIDAGLHPLQYSETLAHEFTHAYGFGDEGTCSFVAYLSLKDADDPFIRYSLLLSYWRTLARNYLSYDNADYQAFRLTLPPQIVADLNAIAVNRQKYPSMFPNLRYQLYDSYLKAQGIKEGMKNYNRVIMLVEGYENKIQLDSLNNDLGVPLQ